MIFLDEYFLRSRVEPEQMDLLWALGWRHFGAYFFRYSAVRQRDGIKTVLPLRIDLEKFSLSRSQKRVMTRNRALGTVIRDTFIDEAKENLFYSHRERFKDNIPDSIYTFLSDEPASLPCANREIAVYNGGRLIAVSFLDIGKAATSAVYAMFDPVESSRSLGIFTMLASIEYSIERSCRYFYPGYAYREPSVYDYKKNFTGLEAFDWRGNWKPYQL
ncbi:MAG: arginine-tRNA-protein transferase [Blastocatellia bacterium]